LGGNMGVISRISPAATGDVALIHVAMPEDRILSNEGTSQRCRTQFDWDEDGLISLASLYRLAQVSVTASQAAGGACSIT
jgi:hypothetical protein